MYTNKTKKTLKVTLFLTIIWFYHWRKKWSFKILFIEIKVFFHVLFFFLKGAVPCLFEKTLKLKFNKRYAITIAVIDLNDSRYWIH